MTSFDLVLGVLAFVGHVALCFALFNRLHALNLNHRWLHGTEAIFALAVIGVMIGFAWDGVRLQVVPGSLAHAAAVFGPWPFITAYIAVCWLAGVHLLPKWAAIRCQANPPACTERPNRVIDIANELGGPPVHGVKARMLWAIPGNQVFRLHLPHKTLRLQNLAPSWDGLTIAHLSDLHLEGAVGLDYFHRVIDETNRLGADLIAITGDIVDSRAALPWIQELLPRLQAELGVFFVLGNHDQRIQDEIGLRRRLTSCGLVDLGSHVKTLTNAAGDALILAGTEQPWFGPPPWDEAVSTGSVGGDERSFRILLSHAPDQIAWRARRQFDVMLAGHTHGGQVRLPGIGPFFVPSLYGLKYAEGFFQEPPTYLHVTRGVGGLEPIRWNCPPELALLTLRSGVQSNRKAPNVSPRSAASGDTVHACS